MPQLVLFQTGNMHFVIDEQRIGVIEPKTVDLRTGQGGHQQRTIAYKGRSCILVDLAAALGPDVAHAHAADAKVIAVKGSPALALWADRIKDVLSVEADQMEALPAVFTSSTSVCFSKVLRIKDQLALVVDTTALEMIEQIAAPSAPAKQRQPKHFEGASRSEQALPLNPTIDPSGDPCLESIVTQKLQQFIGRRVKQVLSRAMTEALGQRRAQL